MKPHACRWCTALATGTWQGTASKTLVPTGVIYHCDDHEEDAWQIARRYPERTSKMIVQPQGLF